jgi:hypothetical protein
VEDECLGDDVLVLAATAAEDGGEDDDDDCRVIPAARSAAIRSLQTTNAMQRHTNISHQHHVNRHVVDEW